MTEISRRRFLGLAAMLGASVVWAESLAKPSRIAWSERRDHYPEGVASGDPSADGVVLWTRRPFQEGVEAQLTVEVAEDESFHKVVATAPAKVLADTDWTCRVLVGGLKPARVYWYRFTDENGFGSRVGRTITAPADNDSRPVKFAFVSCSGTGGVEQASGGSEFVDAPWRAIVPGVSEDRRCHAGSQAVESGSRTTFKVSGYGRAMATRPCA